jgi:hypothetical protein
MHQAVPCEKGKRANWWDRVRPKKLANDIDTTARAGFIVINSHERALPPRHVTGCHQNCAREKQETCQQGMFLQ